MLHTIKMASLEENIEASICKKFKIQGLTDTQRRSIRFLTANKDVFIGTKTGSGKSLIYECIPEVFSETAVTLILAPLRSIMKEQVSRDSEDSEVLVIELLQLKVIGT